MKVIVYGLSDSADPDTVRYVGVCRNLRKRVWTHVREAAAGLRSYKNNWLRSIAPRRPVATVLSVHRSYEAAFAAESRLIARLRVSGAALTNSTNGGPGVVHWTADMRAAASARSRGRVLSEEHKLKVSDGLRGHPVSEATRKKIGAANAGRLKGRKRSAQVRMGYALAQQLRRANEPPAVRAASTARANAARRGCKHSEKTRAKMRASQAGRRALEAIRREQAI